MLRLDQVYLTEISERGKKPDQDKPKPKPKPRR